MVDQILPPGLSGAVLGRKAWQCRIVMVVPIPSDSINFSFTLLKTESMAGERQA
jgi:hypothetical protein